MATKKKESAKAKEPAKPVTAPTGGGSTEDFEKLGVFYLGRPYDWRQNSRSLAGYSTIPKTWSLTQSVSG